MKIKEDVYLLARSEARSRNAPVQIIEFGVNGYQSVALSYYADTPFSSQIAVVTPDGQVWVKQKEPSDA